MANTFGSGLGGGVGCGGVFWVCWFMCNAPFRLIFWIVTVYKKPLGGCTLPLGGLEIYVELFICLWYDYW